MPDAERERRVDAALIHALGGLPDVRDGGRVDADFARGHLRSGANGGHGGE
jgi:hypothetical protein